MVLPIVLYGNTILQKKAIPISTKTPEIEKLICDMFETMHNANGVGLAAPQVGKGIRLFIVDGTGAEDLEPGLSSFKKIFINPTIIERTEKKTLLEEGCLSIPDIREKIYRPDTIKIQYLNENWEEYEETFSGVRSRIIQHEYDHIEGILFVHHFSPLKKKLTEKKLIRISKGICDAPYPIKTTPKK